MISLPSYSEEELCGFEEENNLTIPSELRKHLGTRSRVVCREPERQSANRAFLVELFADDIQTTDPWAKVSYFGPAESLIAILPRAHPFVVKELTKAKIAAQADCLFVTTEEYDLLLAQDAMERLKSGPKKFKHIPEENGDKMLQIADHGYGEEDWICLKTGKVFFSNYLFNTVHWFDGACNSFDEYMKMRLGVGKAEMTRTALQPPKSIDGDDADADTNETSRELRQ